MSGEVDGASWITLAAVAGAHGVRGEVRLKLFTDDPANLRGFGALDAGGRQLTLASIRPVANGAVARFAEITDRTAAEGLRGTTLRVSRTALPALADDEYYHADLIGLPCVSADGEALGEVIAVENFGAGDVVELRRPDGKTAMFPFRGDVATLVDGMIRVDPAFIA